MFDLESKAVDILTSREGIRNQMITYAKSYLELENVDLYKTSFLSYVINVLSILSANQMYYTASTYREFFLTEAQMPESVYNLSKWIGYRPKRAEPATSDILLTIPLTFNDPNVSFVIQDDFKVKSGEIIYTINNQSTVKIDDSVLQSTSNDMSSNDIAIRVLQNKAVTVRNPNGFFYNVVYNNIENTASFLLPFTQYEVKEFIFQVPVDLEFYQFWSFKIEYEGMDWQLKIYEEVSGNAPGVGDDVAWDELDEAESNTLYTMSSHDRNYVWVPGQNIIEVFFGNGVIGKQPNPGTKIKAVLYITKGEEGRVISDTLTTPDKIYYESSTGISPVKITTTNPSSAIGGKDSPTISEIKSRAIANLRSKGRFVSETDYQDIDEILPSTPLSGAVPVLKRSDIKINEIMLFSKLQFQDEICPTRNIVLNTDGTNVVRNLIPVGTNVDVDGVDYETLFAMELDHQSDIANYQYIIRDINVTPVLERLTDFAKYCYIIISTVNYKRIDPRKIGITTQVTNIEDEVTDFECTMTTMWNGNTYNMTTDLDGTGNIIDFFYEYSDYLDVPLGLQKFKFEITGMVPYEIIYGPNSGSGSDPPERKIISIYECTTLIRKDLRNFMMSMITDSTAVHNVPVIKTEYLDNVDRQLFELISIQGLINNIKINTKRMLTDYINIKFPDTTGLLTNMKYNDPNVTEVISKTLTTIPLSPNVGDRYIVNGTENVGWVENINKIAQFTTASNWIFFNPNINDTVIVSDENIKYVWTGKEWFQPIFNIPFNITAVITKDTNVSITGSALVKNIKTALLETFAMKFGLDVNIDRSEIIKVIRSIDGVLYAKLFDPKIDIKFTYKVPNDLSQSELFDFTPQMVAFSYDTISISIQNDED